jgi:hypothetical protein
MNERNLFLLHYNGRDDNLGDQFIFRALSEALEDFGEVHVRTHAADLGFGLRSAMTTLRGGAVYNFLPPGGRTWTTAPSPSRGARGALGALKKRCTDAVAGPRVAIGASVIPTADHSWCRDCEWVGVRDHESLAALRAAGLPRVDYFPDLAFLPAPRRTNPARRGGIRLSFRGAIPEAPDAAEYAGGLSEAIATVMHELDSDVRTNNVRGFYQVDEDAAPSRMLSQAHGFAFEERRVSLDTFESFYASADLVISNRLHCLLLGAHCGAVPVALTSHEHGKVNALFETVGWKSLLLHVEDRGAIAQRLAAIRRDLPRLRNMVASSFDEQRRFGRQSLERRFGMNG